MKKCPYCAEEIQDEAILCRYCHSDLTRPTQQNHPILQTEQTTNQPDFQTSQNEQTIVLRELPTVNVSYEEPNPLASLFFGFLLIGILDFGLIFFLTVFQNFPMDAAYGLFIGILGLRVLVGIVAVYGYKSVGATPKNYIGMLLLAFIPIGSWIALYYAGKAIARRIPAGTALGILLLCFFFGVAIFISTGEFGAPKNISPNNQIIPTSAELNIASEEEIDELIKSKKLQPMYYYAEEPVQVGNIDTYHVELSTNAEPIALEYSWCAKTQDLLNNNWSSINKLFLVDNKIVPKTNMLQFDYAAEIEIDGEGKQPAKCRSGFIVLKDWSEGEHELKTIISLKRRIFDGWSWFEVEYVYKDVYNVKVLKVQNATSSDAPIATATVLKTLKPTSTRKPTPIPTSTFAIPPSCLQPSQAISKNIGDVVCVYGIAGKGTRSWWSNNSESTSEDVYTLIGQDGEWFSLEDTWRLGMTEGSCWIVTGRISLLSGCSQYGSNRCLFLRVTEGRPCK